MAMIINAAMLRCKDACQDQLQRFVDLFGEADVEITEALCVKHASDFDFDWAASRLLSAPAQRAYHEAIASAWRAYQEATASAQRAYREARASAQRAYEEAGAPAWRAYEEARAIAFYRATLI